MKQPNKAQWQELYEAAMAFQQAAPWDWMANEDIFAVVSPLSGEIGYCSILGNGGQEFGLSIFLGDAGLRRLVALIEEQEEDDATAAIMTPGLVFLLANRGELDEEDRKIINSLGLGFRGKNAWPLFRSQRPGYAAWFLEREEVIYLTAALRQALEIAGRMKAGSLDLRQNLMRGKVITRYSTENGWQERWDTLRLGSLDDFDRREPLGAADEAALLLLSSRTKQRSGSWEFDIFVAPARIGLADSRPYHPLCFMAVEREYGLVVQMNMTEPWLNASEKQKEVIRFLEKSETLPEEIRVGSQGTRALLEPISHALGMRLRVSRLRLLEDAKASLYEYLSGRKK
jgi:hypothetical protein